MPGFVAARQTAKISATTRPASRIFAVSCGDFSVTTDLGHRRGGEPLRDRVDRSGAVDAADELRARIVVDDRAGLLLVDIEALADDLGRVVAAALLGPALPEPRQQLVARPVEEDHALERA